MMNLAIIFLPVLFAVIWAAFVGLRINKVEIRESGYDKKLVYTYIRELLDSDKEIKENNNLELLDAYLLDKRFMRELEDDKEYDAA